MVRLWILVLAMEIAAVVVAVLGFGWLILLVGAPLVVATVCLLGVVKLSDVRQSRHQQRTEVAANDPELTVILRPQAGLMSGFFEMPARTQRVEADGFVRR